MADISQYIAEIEPAARGEEVRDAIVNALNAISPQPGSSPEKLPPQIKVEF